MAATVIVFGPTGNIGSVAAQTAQEHGAKVVLAMRNVEKSIPGLSAAQEKAGGFERVQADLTQPDSITAAAKKTGATRAFIYLAFGSPDNMKSSIEALKSGGVEFVVFISSYTVGDSIYVGGGGLDQIPPHEIIPYLHAQVELNLEQVFGSEGYVAIRPGGFATNTLGWKPALAAGELRLFGRRVEMDYITHTDMGRVSGTILAKGSQDGQKHVFLFGPRMWPQEDAAALIAKTLGKDLEITTATQDQAVEMYVAGGIPEPVAKYLMAKMSDMEKAGRREPSSYAEGVANVEKYTGKPAMGFAEWVEANKELFAQ